MFLLKHLEGLASEHHSVINVLTGSKHRWKQQRITNILFSHEFMVNCVWKRLLYSDHKSLDCLLTHWLPMTSIPDAICRIFCNNFKRYYLKNFSRFFLPFLKWAWNFKHFEKKNESPSLIICEIIVSERGCYWNV